MKNLLTLHEAIVIVLLNKLNRTATFSEIADEIENRNLFPIRKGGISLLKQVELRTCQSLGKYEHLFELIAPGTIRVK